MAQVTSGIVKSDTQWYSTFYVEWSRKSYSVADNTSTLEWKAGLITSNGVYWQLNAVKINSIVINGTTVLSGQTYSNISGNGTHQLASGTITIKHDDNGKKSFGISISGWLYDTGSPSGRGTFELVDIPRYLSISSLEITNKTETSIVVKWSTSDPRNSTYYSFDNGATWVGSATDGESLASDGKSGTFNILNLTANTKYKLKVKFKRTDSGLWTESNAIEFTTYNYPYCSKSSDFTIGDALTLEFYNPLSRSITVKGYSVRSGGEVFGGTTNGTKLVGFNDENTINRLYNSIPNHQEGAYTVVVSYGNANMTRNSGNVYRVRGTEVPTINGFDYIDGNSSTLAITGNNTHIVQNLSELVARVNPAKANYGAGSIKRYVMLCNGKGAEGSIYGSYNLGTIDSERDVDLTLTVTDSRGLSASKTIKVTMLAHSDPTALVTLQRLNNYEDETYLTVDGSVSSVNNKNTMTIKYRYKLSGSSYGNFITIGDRAKQTLSLDKNNVYIFNIVITDAFGSQYNKEHTLGKGVFPLFIDTVKNSVGINCFPTENQSFEVNGFNLYNVYKCCKSIGVGIGGLRITINKYANSDKMPLFVMGADNSSLTPVFTIIHLRTDTQFGFVNLGIEKTVTRSGNVLHIDASQYSYYTVFAPLGMDISLSSGAL